jgi:hypothetical protein
LVADVTGAIARARALGVATAERHANQADVDLIKPSGGNKAGIPL